MSIDLSSETVIPLRDGAKHCPGRPHISTFYRWMQRSQNPLETIKVGGRIYTSVEAIQRFAERCSNPGVATNVRTSKQRQREIQHATTELTKVGI